jgi:hypothetical protein
MADQWIVTGQRETSIIGPDDRFVPAIHVTFKTKQSGLTGSVDIPKSLYTAAYVQRMIDIQSTEMEAVHTL